MSGKVTGEKRNLFGGETIGRRDDATRFFAVPITFVVKIGDSFLVNVKKIVCVVSRSAREDVVSVLFCVRSMSMCRIVLIRGEETNFFFFNRSFVSRVVRWTGRPQRVFYCVNVHQWLCVQLCVDIVCCGLFLCCVL